MLALSFAIGGCVGSGWFSSRPVSAQVLDKAREVSRGKAALTELRDLALQGRLLVAGEAGSLCPFDTDRSDKLNDEEILNLIVTWSKGQSLLTDQQVLRAIALWVANASIDCYDAPPGFGGGGGADYYQDVDIGGDPNTNEPQLIGAEYVEPSTALVYLATTVPFDWKVGDSYQVNLGDYQSSLELRRGERADGTPTRILRLHSPHFNRFKVRVTLSDGTKVWQLTHGPVVNGMPVANPYPDREKRFSNEVVIDIYAVPGKYQDYKDLANTLRLRFTDYHQVIESSFQVWEEMYYATIRVITEKATPWVMDVIPNTSVSYDITYAGRRVTLWGRGVVYGLFVMVGDLGILATEANAVIVPAENKVSMGAVGGDDVRGAATVSLEWKRGAVEPGVTYALRLSPPERVDFQMALYDRSSGQAFFFPGYAPYPEAILSSVGGVRFSLLDLYFDNEFEQTCGRATVYVNWKGYAVPMREGDPVPAVVYGTISVKRECAG
jgi:hypothetical protein